MKIKINVNNLANVSCNTLMAVVVTEIANTTIKTIKNKVNKAKKQNKEEASS